MFGISGPEFLFILIVALVVLGPRDLPRAMLQLGRAVWLMRRKAQDLQNEAGQLLRDLELDDVKAELERTARDVQSVAVSDVPPAAGPLGRETMQMQTAVEQVGQSIEEALDAAVVEPAPAPRAARHVEPLGAGTHGGAG